MLTAPPPPTLHAAPPPPAAAATHLPTLDFECYSEAGYVRNLKTGGWDKLGPKGGIADVGAWAYSRHPSTEIIWLAYDLLDGNGVQSWFPWLPAPLALFEHVTAGGLLEAHNSFFEYAVWNNVFRRQCGAPKLPIGQLRDSAAVCAAYGLPRSLEKSGEVLGLSVQKDVKAAAKVKKLWVPRKPTKNNPATRITIDLDTELHMLNGSYCETDVRAEQAISATVPPLSDYELRVQQLDQLANARGVHIDRSAVDAAAAVIDQLKAKYVPMQYALTGGLVKSPNSYAALKRWVCDQGVDIPDTQADTITATLKRKDLPPVVREVLEIQQMVGGAAIKKIFAMQRFADPDDDRVRGVFSYCGASSTGRWASRGVQLHNNPNSGPDHYKCSGCEVHFAASHEQCPLCGGARAGRKEEWSAEAAESAIALIMQRSAELLERVWVNALDVITASIRGFICAAEGYDLICADYSAIEARVIAVLAGEEWRLEVFRGHGKIYEASACQMFNMTMDDFISYKKEHDSHHPARKKGKVSELALGYQGGVGAMLNFGADSFMTRKEMKDTIRNWRDASPNIVKLWHELESCARQAIQFPGQVFSYRLISYQMRGAVLYARLPSGRELTYHNAGLKPVWVRWEDGPEWDEEEHRPVQIRREYLWAVDGAQMSYKIEYMKEDGGRWVRSTLYGGLAVENVVQATARDLLADALLRLEAAGYPVIMHVHDEVICEVPHGVGSAKELEEIMEQNPSWAAGWPIKADGGWRGLRYRK